MISLVNYHTDATRIGWHLWEIDLKFAPGLPPGWPTFKIRTFAVSSGTGRGGAVLPSEAMRNEVGKAWQRWAPSQGRRPSAEMWRLRPLPSKAPEEKMVLKM